VCFRVPELFLGVVAATAIWATVFIWQSSAQRGPNNSETQQTTQQEKPANNPLVAFWRWTTHDPVAFYTSVLALFTAVLGISTIGLWIVTARGVRNQTRDTEIIQRAYISVEPNGITPHYNKGDRVVASVIFRNVGHLPARNVRWYGKIEKRGFSFGDDYESFPTDEPFEGKIVLPPGTQTSVELGAITTEILGTMAFIWGIVTYDDGFGKTRYTRFCHRYRTRHLTAETFNLSGRDAALHRYGNDAN
jgi:hypothetical protein